MTLSGLFHIYPRSETKKKKRPQWWWPTFEVPVHSSGFSWGEVEFLNEEHPKRETTGRHILSVLISTWPWEDKQYEKMLWRTCLVLCPICITIPGTAQEQECVAKWPERMFQRRTRPSTWLTLFKSDPIMGLLLLSPLNLNSRAAFSCTSASGGVLVRSADTFKAIWSELHFIYLFF